MFSVNSSIAAAAQSLQHPPVKSSSPGMKMSPASTNGSASPVAVSAAYTSSSNGRVPIIRRDRESICEQKCAVCGCLTREFHFGAVCCVACAAFFRRAVVEGRVFVCRRGGRCTIDGNGRATCRACRFRKCVDVGMDTQAVQPPRSSSNRRDTTPPSETAEASPSQSHSAATDNETVLAGFKDAIEFFQIKEPVCSTSTEPNSVERMLLAIEATRMNRRHLYSNGSLAELIRGEEPKPRPVHIFHRLRRSVLRTESALLLSLLCRCPIYAKFDAEEKEELFKHFMLVMMVVEKYFITMQKGGIDTNRLYNTDGSYTDLDNEETAFPKDTTILDRSTMMKLFIDPHVANIQTLSVAMRDMEMTEVDVAGFLVFLLFDPDIPALRKDRKIYVEQARTSVHNDWVEVYQRRSVPNYHMRIARCLGLMPQIEAICEQGRETFHLLRVFELFHYDEILADIFSVPPEHRQQTNKKNGGPIRTKEEDCMNMQMAVARM